MVFVRSVYVSVTFVITCETLSCSSWSVVSTSSESALTNKSPTNIIFIPMLVSQSFIFMIALLIMFISLWDTIIAILCDNIRLIDCMIALSILQVPMVVSYCMDFYFANCAPGSFSILHVEWTIFCCVQPMFLANITKEFCFHKADILLADFLSTIVFGMVDH